MSVDDRSEAIAIARQMDWFDPDFRSRTEYEVYDAVRGLPPQRSERTGEWFFLGYDDAREAFQRADLLSNDWIAEDNPLGQVPGYPDNLDGDVQREYRRLLDPLFNPQRMSALEDEITDYARQLLRPLAAQAKVDLADEFTIPFPTVTFCRLMGFPLDDHPRLMRWKDSYLNAMTPFVANQLGVTDLDEQGRPTLAAARELTLRTGAEVYEYVGALIEARRSQPEDDLLSRLVALRRADGSPFTEEELVRITFNLFLGGLDTVTGMLSLIVQQFAQHPEQRAEFVALMDDPERVGPAIEELVRFHSIVAIPRRVAVTCPFRGADLVEGDMVWVNTAAADRDNARFPDADTVDYARSPNPHLGFGLGRHRCLGIHLARRELRIGLQELHRIIPEYRLDPDDEPLVGSGGVRGLFTLPLLIG
jgi:cytochrome P450